MKKREAKQIEPEFAGGVTRRQFVTTAGILTGGIAFGVPRFSQGASAESKAQWSSAASAVSLRITVNGRRHALSVDPRLTLLDLLREELVLTGTKKGCDHGQCGACTVLANGRRINSCLSLALVHDGDEITTIEGLARNGDLDPLQSAFIECDGFQCGYCTSGQICSAAALLTEVEKGAASFVTEDVRKLGAVQLTPEEIRERMSGNICRCGAYPGIVQAVQKAYEQKHKT